MSCTIGFAAKHFHNSANEAYMSEAWKIVSAPFFLTNRAVYYFVMHLLILLVYLCKIGTTYHSDHAF